MDSEKIFMGIMGVFCVLMLVVLCCIISDGIKCKQETGFFDCKLKAVDQTVRFEHAR